MPDPVKNFATSLVATAPSPATSGTSLVVTTGEGTRYPATPFNAVIAPAASDATPANSEVVRVTNISSDTLTITRTQESSSARTVTVGDRIYVSATAKTLTDLRDNNGFQAHRLTGVKVEAYPRMFAASNVLLVSGTVVLTKLSEPLRAGVTYTSITFANAGTGLLTPSHIWFTLTDANRVTLRSSADDTAGTWAGNADKTLSLSSTYTPSVDTEAYVGVCVVAGTMPNVRAFSGTSIWYGHTPILTGTSSTSQTTPPADGSTLTAITATSTFAWGGVS